VSYIYGKQIRNTSESQNPHFTLVQQWIPNNLSESQNPHFTLVQQWIPQKKHSFQIKVLIDV